MQFMPLHLSRLQDGPSSNIQMAIRLASMGDMAEHLGLIGENAKQRLEKMGNLVLNWAQKN
jgi:hypothetical protein